MMLTEQDRAWLASGALVGLGTLTAAAAWAGAAAGALLAGGPVAPASPLTIYHMTRDWGAVWPGSATASAVGAVVVTAVTLAAAVWLLVLARRWHHHPRGLATLHQVREMTPSRAARTAARLRSALDGRSWRDIPPRDRGVLLGDHLPSRVELRGSDEDTYLAIMAPRAGKTTALAVPVAEEAPAALLLTSNKADLYAATAAGRGRVGTVWTLDTQGVAQVERSWWWDIIAAAGRFEHAERLASHFIAQVRSEAADPFWHQAAQDLLVGLLRAAWHDGATMRDVLTWVADPTEQAPMRILHRHEPVLAHQIESSVRIAEETQSGIYQNVRTALSALRDEEVLAWVMPDPSRPRFDPEHFATSRDTLCLLSKKGGPASALVAALADTVFTAASEAGERAGGRLPEPMRAVLDEAANICRISDLPDLYSHLGSRGITPITILQSYRQGVAAWGEVGMDALWSAATKKIIGAGVDDWNLASGLATLIGQHTIPRASYSKGREGYSRSLSEQREQRLEASEIRAMPKGTALLLATGTPVAQIALRPWYREASMAHIAQDMTAEQQAITERATAAHLLRKGGRDG